VWHLPGWVTPREAGRQFVEKPVAGTGALQCPFVCGVNRVTVRGQGVVRMDLVREVS
jgi:hypothetical protein